MLRCRCNGMINAGCSGTTRMRSASLTRSPTPYINDANKRLLPCSSYSNASTSGSASVLDVVTNPIDIGHLRLIGIATETKHPLHLMQKGGFVLHRPALRNACILYIYTVDRGCTKKDHKFGYTGTSGICFRDIPKVS